MTKDQDGFHLGQRLGRPGGDAGYDDDGLDADHHHDPDNADDHDHDNDYIANQV